MRKGTVVRYIGTKEIMKGRNYTVIKKNHGDILIYAPVKHSDGTIHDVDCYMNVKDFEIVK